jgi:flavin reductase (DIM6/NTAB) family NADH-FMN oxidoreductase RutF
MKKDLHSLFQKLTHGVYVIGVSCMGENNAFTASWVMQVSFTPLLLALSINPDHSSYKLLKEGGVFSVNVLPKDRFDLAEHFGQPESTDKLSSVVWHQGKTTAPVLDDAIAFFECKFSHECEAGDHRLVIGRVTSGAMRKPQALPMNYQETGAMDGSSSLFPEDFV